MRKKLLIILMVNLCIALIFIFSSCDDKVSSKGTEPLTETEGIELAKDNEIVEFELFGKIKNGMTYEEVTKILNNPGKKSSFAVVHYAYRLSDNYVAFIHFHLNKVVELRIEPLLSPESYEYIKKQVEQNGYALVNNGLLDTLGTLGNHVGSGMDIHEYYLSDGRIVLFTFGYVDNYDGLVIISAGPAGEPWFEP